MDPGEAKRRISAARILRDLTQEEMSRRGADEFGLDRQELGRTERGTLDFTEGRKLVLCRVLDVPESWFDEPDVDELVGLRRAREQDALALFERLLADHGRGRDPSPEASPADEDEEDRPDEAAGDAGA